MLIARGVLPAGVAVRRCRACGFDFLERPCLDRYWDTPGQEDIYEDGDIERERVESFGTILGRLAAFAETGTLLDIGAGKGEFALLAARAGWRVFVLEPSERATEGLEARGIAKVYNASLEDFRPAQQYHAVTLLDVLEHTANPAATIASAAACLKPGGTLAVLTPDGASALRSAALFASRIVPPLGGALKYQYYYPHLCYVSARGFSLMAHRCGLDVLSVEKTATPKRFLMAKLERHYGKYAGNRAMSTLVSVAYPLARTCLGNKLLAFARKRP